MTTAPSVSYNVYTTKGNQVKIDNPSHLPPMTEIERIEEPIVKTTIYTRPEYVGPIMELCQEKRGMYGDRFT